MEVSEQEMTFQYFLNIWLSVAISVEALRYWKSESGKSSEHPQ